MDTAATDMDTATRFRTTYLIRRTTRAITVGRRWALSLLWPAAGRGAPPAEQTLHIIVDSAPQRTAPHDEVADAAARAGAYHARKPSRESQPTLVFRDGHKQEVTNYAIMGQTLYVFDNRTKKIALADLDVPATIKANDDEGVEFQVPKAKQSSKPAKPGVPLQSAPDDSPKTSSSMSTTP